MKTSWTTLTRTLLVLGCVLLLVAPTTAIDDPNPWYLDDIEELGCGNFKCTFCRDQECDKECTNPLDDRDCIAMLASSASECEELLDELNEALGGGKVTPSRNYVHAVTDWTSLVARPDHTDCAGCDAAWHQPRERPFVLELVRTFRSRLYQHDTDFGRRWQHNYDYELEFLEGSEHIEAVIRLPSDRRLEFVDVGKTGSFEPWNETEAAKPTLSADGDDWLLSTRKGALFHFTEASGDLVVQYRPDWIEDRTGYRLSFEYDGDDDGSDRLETISDSFGRELTLEWGLLWDVWPVVLQARLPDGRMIDYAYTTLEDYTVTYPNGDVSTYARDVDVDGEFFAFHDALGNLGSRKHRVYTTASGQVRGVTDVHGELLFVPRMLTPNVIRYEYATGKRETVTFADDGYPQTLVQEDTGATRSWTWNATLGQKLSETDVWDHTTLFEYEDGQLVTRTWPDGSVQTFGWDPVTHLLGAYWDENGALTVFNHDAWGNRVLAAHPDASLESWIYGPYGLLQTHVNGAGFATRHEWDANGYLARTILPDDDFVPGNEPVRDYVHDLTGRLLSQTDPLGRTTSWDWDAVDRVVRSSYPDGTTAEQVYGTNGSYPVDLAGTTNLVLARKDRADHWMHYSYDGLDNRLTLTDDLGLKTSWTYVPGTRLVETVDEEGDTSWFTYDARGRMATRNVQVDATTVLTWTYEYEPLDRLIHEYDPYGYETLLAYDTRGHVVVEVLEYEPTWILISAWDYDPVGNLISWQDANEHFTTYTYDPMGRLLDSIDPLGAVTSRQYDLAGNPYSTTDPLGNTTWWTYTARNQMASEHDALGGVRTFSYDLADQLVTETDALGNPKTYVWGCCGRLLAETTFVDGGAHDITETYAYDGEGRRTQRLDGEGHPWTTAYDPRGRVLLETDPLGNTVQTAYPPDGSSIDPRLAAGQGQLVQRTDANGHVTTTAYDALQRPLTEVDPLGHVTRWSWDIPAGDFVARTVTDRNGNVSTEHHDGLGRTVAEIDALGNTTTYSYDYVGNRLTLCDALGQVSSWTYDDADRVLSETLADGATTQYAWTLTGWLASITDAAGDVTQFEHDALGRPLVRRWADASADMFTYDPVGRLTGATSGLHPLAGSVLRQYDPAGRMLQEDSNGFTVSWAYDRRSLPTQLVTPEGTLFTRTYTPRGQLASIADTSSTHVAWSFDAAGRPLQAQLGNGTTAQMTWDPLDRMLAIQHSSGLTDVHSLSYVYDPEGNRLATHDASFPERSETAKHDALDRLLRWKHGDDPPDLWTLDAVGNWLAVNRDGLLQEREHGPTHELLLLRDVQGGVGPGQPGPLGTLPAGPSGPAPGGLRPGVTPKPSLVDETVLTYDVQGRLVHDELRTYEYGLDGLLLRVRLAATGELLGEYAYDALGRRVLRDDRVKPDFVRYVHDGQQVLEERGAGGDLLATYLHGQAVDELVARLGPAGNTYYHLDARHDTKALTDAAGVVTERCEVGPYGDCMTYDAAWGTPEPASRHGNPYIVAGRELDAESGLLHYRARSYSADLGRFLQRDPLWVSQGPNAYEFVGGNPLVRGDPSGTSLTVFVRCMASEASCSAWTSSIQTTFWSSWSRHCAGPCTGRGFICSGSTPRSPCWPLWWRHYSALQELRRRGTAPPARAKPSAAYKLTGPGSSCAAAKALFDSHTLEIP